MPKKIRKTIPVDSRILPDIKKPSDICFGHLMLVEDFAKSLLKGKNDKAFNRNVFRNLIDIEVKGTDIKLTLKNVMNR